MRWSWRIGTVAGIGVYMHATFLLLLAWVALSYWITQHSVAAVLHGVLFILALFGCVVLHELGHALAARRFGIRTRDITLLPIGGVARLERMPEKPAQELWVAVAGPLVNVAIAAALAVWLMLTSAGGIGSVGMEEGSFAARLLVVNVFLVVFNLLPAFPMDGGRVLRALLATRMNYARATHIAATIGQGMALLLGFAGFFGNPMLVFIAFFVWVGAAQESSFVQMKSAVGNIPIDHAMITDFHTLRPEETLDDAIRMLLTGSQHDFPVLDGDRVVGVLTRGNLLHALAQRDRATPVGEVMSTEFQVVEAAEMMDGAFRRLQDCACTTVPVLREGRLVGLMTLENLGELLMIQNALSSRARRR